LKCFAEFQSEDKKIMQSLLGILAASVATAADPDGDAGNQEPSKCIAGKEPGFIIHCKKTTKN